MQERLVGWKAHSLSLAGRIMLAKPVLSSIPIYAMQKSGSPSGVCLEMERKDYPRHCLGPLGSKEGSKFNALETGLQGTKGRGTGISMYVGFEQIVSNVVWSLSNCKKVDFWRHNLLGLESPLADMCLLPRALPNHC